MSGVFSGMISLTASPLPPHCRYNRVRKALRPNIYRHTTLEAAFVARSASHTTRCKGREEKEREKEERTGMRIVGKVGEAGRYRTGIITKERKEKEKRREKTERKSEKSR